MDAAPTQKPTVVAGPGLSVAAQVATQVATQVNAQLPPSMATVKPVDIVDKDFVESIGIRTTGWLNLGKAFWRQHSVQFWSAAAGLETALQVAQTWIPSHWESVGHYVVVALGWLGILFKARRQANLIVDNIRQEVARHTS